MVGNNGIERKGIMVRMNNGRNNGQELLNNGQMNGKNKGRNT